MKQKEEEAQNIFERVADVRGFISETRLEPDTSVTIKLCCISAERLNGGYEEALHRGITVWDSKAIKGSFAKANVDFQPGAVYVFRKVDGVGFYADIAKGNVQYEGGGSGKVFELELPIKKQKVVETPKRSGKGKSPSALSCKRAVFPVASGDDISMAMG
ncbi:hypothetical protein PC129_g23023 [Phytophthora cactorum]|nr:hypothetical protein PC111_g22197 [Phytophthora cactorum]KAG2871838.1 hypothetical protein PC114_g26704 [Phytophthora cactorum]KAG2877605.1 hypothetical protein PC115_g23328 [Phytophthora cactorum]KAG2961426.1 hypothetical protein PC118_g21976 [Phytophthora cactorum]KAG2978882.1 hypothetical protein PC120_g25230 [Phytophthora cactorum]